MIAAALYKAPRLLVVLEGAGPGGDNDRYMDLRVEEFSPTPIDELVRLRARHASSRWPTAEIVLA